VLTTPAGLGPLAVTNTVLAGHLHQIVQVFREGGGVPYAAFTPEFTDAMDAMGRGVFDTMLVDGYLPLAPGLAETLTAGARVADVACGTGHALVPGGLLFMREPHAADTLAGNLANPMAPVFYSVSTLHCLTVSLAHGGAGIGSAFGEQLARRMLTEAGFGPADVHPAPGHPFDAVYVTRTAR